MRLEEQNICNSANGVLTLSGIQLTEQILGDVEWLNDTQGYCECPGRDGHTNQNGRRDCMVYLDAVPTLYCVHTSCRDSVNAKNRELRQALAGEAGETRSTRLTVEQKRKIDHARHQTDIRKRVVLSRDRLMKENEWTLAEITADSPITITDDPTEHSRLLLERFPLSDIVWIGDTRDSGSPEHVRNFKPASEWLAGTSAAGPFICPAAFKPGSSSRSNDNVAVRRFLVVESDTLGKDQVGAVFRWLNEKVGLRLVAIVDTAGKSLHAWFKFPNPDVLEELKLVLPILGCDPKLFTASQPVRLPGALREGKYQRLVYLDNEVQL